MGRRVAGEILAAPEMAAEIQELLTQGLSKRTIAAQLGVSETTVYRCLRDLSRGAGKQRGGGAGGQRGGGAEGQRSGGAEVRGSGGEEGQRCGGAAEPGEGGDDGYPVDLLRQVPRDFVAVLPREHYRALRLAASRAGSAAAAESLRLALLLHEEPMIPPPTSIELVLSEAEEEEWKTLASRGRSAATSSAPTTSWCASQTGRAPV